MQKKVQRVECVIQRNKADTHDMIVMEYHYGDKYPMRAYLCFDHDPENFAFKKAQEWWIEAAQTTPPESVEEAHGRRKEIRIPDSIDIGIEPGSKYPSIFSYKYDDNKKAKQLEQSEALVTSSFADDDIIPF